MRKSFAPFCSNEKAYSKGIIGERLSQMKSNNLDLDDEILAQMQSEINQIIGKYVNPDLNYEIRIIMKN